MKTTFADVDVTAADAVDREEDEPDAVEAAEAPGDDTTMVLVATADPFED